ncbi:unnamed protein product [Rhodiola kirilowii]
MSSQTVSVQRGKLAACMRCGVCQKLMRDATTISECMHHFCRKCIYKKITIEEVESCPVCGVNLGADPLEKLRPDHNLRELRAKFFGSKRLEAQSANVEPELLSESHARRKERSLSSLAANAPKQRSEPGPTGKRMKHLTGRSRYVQSSSHLEKSNSKKKNNLLDLQLRSSSSENKYKSSEENSDDESPLVKKRRDKADDNVKPPHTSDDIWDPLNCLVEVANKTKPAEILNTPNEVQVWKSYMKDHGLKTKIDKSFQFRDPKKPRKVHLKKNPEIPIRIIPSSTFSEHSSSKNPRNGPIWLQLLASENQETDMPFPQILTSYLRIKYGSMTVSQIRKYIMQKLYINNEDEIEISCMGQRLSPAMPITDVVSTWLQATETPEKITVKVGSSAKDFIVVVTYSRKAPPPPPPPTTTSSLSFLHL